jgi:hypothetical protein
LFLFFYIQIKINMKIVVIQGILKVIIGIKYIKSYSWN